MSRSWIERPAAWLAIIFALSGCSTTPDPQASVAEPEPQPVAVGEGGSRSVAFQKVLFRIPAGTPLSVTRLRGRVVDESNWTGEARESESFNVTATDELKRLGYDVRDESGSVFTPETTTEARYRIAAIVHSINLEFDVRYKSGTYQTAYESLSSSAKMKIEFQIFDAEENVMVAKTTVPGSAVEVRAPNSSALMPKAFVAGLRRAFADEKFVAPLLKDTSKVSDAGADARNSLSVKRCAGADHRLPGDLPRIQESIVEIVIGSGGGTGAIVSDDGFVLTAAHVVGSQPQVVLRFKSGFEIPAEVVRVDKGRDAALVKAPGRGYSCLGVEPAAVAVGSTIWAIGNPLTDELARSVTRGVASGNRVIRDRTYLQTDAAINPGNSGGPIVDDQGLIRGIVVGKLSGSGLEGLGFAVPISDAVSALDILWQ